MAEIEAILNTRPLMYVNFENYAILRPIDFISPNTSFVTQSFQNDNQEEYTPNKMNTREKLAKYWLHTNKVLDTFWELGKRNI